MDAKQVPSCLVVRILFCLLVISASAKPSNRIKSLTVIKELNRKGPCIGLITVFPPEENAFLGAGSLKPHPRHLICPSVRKTISSGKSLWEESNLCEMGDWNGMLKFLQ